MRVTERGSFLRGRRAGPAPLSLPRLPAPSPPLLSSQGSGGAWTHSALSPSPGNNCSALPSPSSSRVRHRLLAGRGPASGRLPPRPGPALGLFLPSLLTSPRPVSAPGAPCRPRCPAPRCRMDADTDRGPTPPAQPPQQPPPSSAVRSPWDPPLLQLQRQPRTGALPAQ